MKIKIECESYKEIENLKYSLNFYNYHEFNENSYKVNDLNIIINCDKKLYNELKNKYNVKVFKEQWV